MAKKLIKLQRKAITVKSARPITMKPNPAAAKHYIFKLTRYGIKRKRCRKYHYSCVLKDCAAHFKNVKEWNEHHQLRHPHKTYSCYTCSKVCDTPVSFKDHTYFHGVKKFICGRCNKRFINNSQLNLHKHIHRRDQLYKCFAPKCTHNYKWPQDVLRHIKVHLSTVYKCTQCSYSNKEKRLLQQHINIHTDDLPYRC